MADLPLPDTTASACPKCTPPTADIEHRHREWLSPPAASAIYDLSLKTVWRRIADGTLPAYKVAGTRSVRIKIADLDAMMIPITNGGAE